MVLLVSTTVSIPVGFSDALRRGVNVTGTAYERFQSLLGFLMRCDARSDAFLSHVKFQSLLGFLMRCDVNDLPQPVLPIIVSIPVGFSDALRPMQGV